MKEIQISRDTQKNW